MQMNIYTQGNWHRDDTWQRVVDNELTPAELGELVEVCEREPELWKRCAVAFLEERALQSEMKQLGALWQSGPQTAIPLPAIAANKPCSSAGSSAPNHSGLLNCLALVATVLLAFLVGWQAALRSDNHSRAGSAAVATSSTISGEIRPRAKIAEVSRDNGQAGLPDDAGLTDDAWLAGYEELGSASQFVLVDKRMPKQLADLEQRGLVRVESIEGFMPVQLTDGFTAVVPIQQLDVRSVRSTY
jgi:hypothetical protein